MYIIIPHILKYLYPVSHIEVNSYTPYATINHSVTSVEQLQLDKFITNVTYLLHTCI